MPLTPEDLKQIKDLITEVVPETVLPTVNKALDARMKNVMSASDFEKWKAEQKAAADEAAKAATDAAAKGGGNRTDDKPAGGVEESPAYRKAMAEIEELKRQTAAEREARRQAEAQRLVDHRAALIREALGKAGVDPRAQRAALNHVLGEGLVKIKDDGKIVYQVPNQFGGVDESDVEAGIGAFLKTPEGKLFLPADTVRGAGGTGGNNNNFRPQGGNQSTVSPEEIVLQALANL